MLESARRILSQIMERRLRFLGAFVAVFFATLLILTALGLAPTDIVPKREVGPERAVPALSASEVPDPLRVRIPAIGTDAPVVNPRSRDVAVLDAALREGVVRYPAPGSLADPDAHLFLFGHSSYLPAVRNPAYRAFNNLAKLSPGDEIVLESNARAYRYVVRSVRLAAAEEALVDLSPGARRLTLSTCNSFGAPSERFVVEADFVGTSVLSEAS